MGSRNRLAQIVVHWPDEITNKGKDLGSHLRKLQHERPKSLDSPVHTNHAIVIRVMQLSVYSRW